MSSTFSRAATTVANGNGQGSPRKNIWSRGDSSHSTDPYDNIAGSCVDLKADNDDVSLTFGSVSTDDETIYEMSSVPNTSRAEFEDKYLQLRPIGEGGYGSVYGGVRKSDSLPVAIKHMPLKKVTCEQVIHNGKEYTIVLEVALMLKTAGLPGSVGQSAAVSLLDWYILGPELILVMERPVPSQDLFDYLEDRESLDEHEAKLILRQLVDAAVDMDTKGVFHRDIKLENVLVQLQSDGPRVRLIDFGCGCFSTEKSYSLFSGTREYAPPECFDAHTHSSGPTTVWQLGALFYLLLSGHNYFTTMDFINGNISINSALSTKVKTLLHMCLARDPMERATLEELQQSPALR